MNTMAAKTALITGVTGQDGSYLAEFLLGMGYRVAGIVRRASTENFQRIEHLRDQVELFQADLLDQTSLAGILAEVARPVVVIGLGLNVTQAPGEVDGPGATSLLDLGVPAPDRDQLVRGLLRELDARIAGWRATRGSDSRLAADYRARSLTIGSPVCAQLPGGREVVGTATGIDDQGRLCLETDGETVVVSAGDVLHLR